MLAFPRFNGEFIPQPTCIASHPSPSHSGEVVEPCLPVDTFQDHHRRHAHPRRRASHEIGLLAPGSRIADLSANISRRCPRYLVTQASITAVGDLHTHSVRCLCPYPGSAEQTFLLAKTDYTVRDCSGCGNLELRASFTWYVAAAVNKMALGAVAAVGGGLGRSANSPS